MALKLPKLNINKTWVMLLVAITLAVLAAALVSSHLKGREAAIAEEINARAKQGGVKVSVVVPIQDLAVGTPLTDNVVAARDVAADLLYPGAIGTDEFEKYKGQSLIRPVLKGRPLLKPDLHPMYADFAGSLTDGTRAMTVDVDELNSVSHMVQPGNRVDLMLVLRRDAGGQTVVPFMDRMKVLATGQRVVAESGGERTLGAGPSKRNDAYSTLTLEVSPIQAARLALAQDLGRLRYVLRNEKDTSSADFSVDAKNIFDEIAVRARAQKRTVVAPVSADFEPGSVEFIVGGQRSGPTAKSVGVDVPFAMGNAGIPPRVVPAVPAIAPPAAAGGNAAAGPDANGLTPQMREQLKAMIEK